MGRICVTEVSGEQRGRLMASRRLLDAARRGIGELSVGGDERPYAGLITPHASEQMRDRSRARLPEPVILHETAERDEMDAATPQQPKQRGLHDRTPVRQRVPCTESLKMYLCLATE